MKKWIAFLMLLLPLAFCQAQKYDAVTLMLAFQQKYANVERVSGELRWNKQNGQSTTGHFVVEGEKFRISWNEGELVGDGQYEWEIIHRSKRIKKRFYDPLISPAVVMAFRLIRLDLTAEPVKIGGSADQIAIDIEFGSSVAQGNHQLVIDQKTLDPSSITIQVVQDEYFEKADIAQVRLGDQAKTAEYSIDFAEWKKKGYSLTDMAKGESDAVWPEERALKANE